MFYEIEMTRRSDLTRITVHAKADSTEDAVKYAMDDFFEKNPKDGARLECVREHSVISTKSGKYDAITMHYRTRGDHD